MKHEIVSGNTFTLVPTFHCVCFSSIKSCVYRENMSSDIENLTTLNFDK